jgi:3-oxoacyl-[acyl-carrier-protein] synthase-1
MAQAGKLTLHITGAGAVTCVGFDLASTTAAIEAGIDGFQETQYVDSMGQPLIGAPIPAEDPEEDARGVFSGGLGRPAKFVAMAIEESLEKAGIELNDAVEAYLICVLPEFSPDDSLMQLVLAESRSRLGCDLFGDRHKIATGGAVAMGRALEFSKSWLGERPQGVVVISAFDTWLNVARINQGLGQQRFLDSDKSDGLIPGEAASAIVLQSGPIRGHRPNLEILGVGTDSENIDLQANRLCTGVGLAQAAKKALSQSDLQAHEMRRRLANITGEEYFFSESSYAWSRVLRTPLPPEYRYQLISSSIGEVGSGFGPLILGYALQSCLDFSRSNEHVLIQLSSAGPARCAIVGTVNLNQSEADVHEGRKNA